MFSNHVFELGTFCFVHREISELEIAEEGWDLGSDHGCHFRVPSYISTRILVRHLSVANPSCLELWEP